ncbi:MAG: zf-TFIIB domain-containing protein [bacterium]
MQAETLNCPMCGAAASTDDPLCNYCGSRLATVACASCFGMMFLGSKHCPRCGAAAAERTAADLPAQKCPRCGVEMQSVKLGATTVRECERCLGLWVDVLAFEKICADREQQSAVLGAASPEPTRTVQETNKIRYVPCPECGQLMNRINFAHCSGVIVDICKGHGSWFDREELSRIVEFIRGGGLEASRAKEKAWLEEERRQLMQDKHAAEFAEPSLLGFGRSNEEHRGLGIASARGLLKHLLD